MNKIITSTLKDHGVDATVAEVQHGASVDRYLLTLAAGVKVSTIERLSGEVALALGAQSARIYREGAHIAVEVPAAERRMVRLPPIEQDHPLRIPIGESVGGDTVIARLDKMPHLLVAGTTGSGKSNFVTCVLAHLVTHTSPARLQLMLMDPKRVELAPFAHVAHLAAPVATDVPAMLSQLEDAVDMMELRYAGLEQSGKRNVDELDDPPPYLVIVVDELADLIMSARKRAEDSIVRLLQKGRAAGIHLILATQRPSVDVVTGLIKGNTPSRMAFAVASHTDSSVALGQTGAETLLGQGDGLYWPAGAPKPERIQAPYLSTDELDEMLAPMNHLDRQCEKMLENIETADAHELGEEEPVRTDVVSEGRTDAEHIEALERALTEARERAGSEPRSPLPAVSDDLPGMWEPSDLSGGEADTANARLEEPLLDAAYAKGREHQAMLERPQFADRRVMTAADWWLAVLLFLAGVVGGLLALPLLPLAAGVWLALTVTRRRTTIHYNRTEN